MAVTVREQQVATELASLAARELNKGAAARQVSSTTEAKSQEQTRTRRVGSIGGGASDLHFLAAASLPADAGDHEDAVTVAAVGGEGGEDEDAAGENADNDNLESILLQKGATTRLLQKASTPPTGPLTRDTKLPWDGIL